ncbi:MAG: precorrin-6A/cobalt-precorrin-6A reductase, partial [Thermacetogeniaceae bacterium]
ADYVVMKDSGKEGGTDEKIKACRKLKIKAVIIGRQNEKGAEDLDAVINLIQQNNNHFGYA